MNHKPVLNIVGGGISGLAAGIYACMNGFETHIFEKSSKPGGVCQSWNRKDFTVNGSIHWLMGSGPGTEYYWMWRELGVIENTAFYHHSSFFDYETEDGKLLRIFTDIHKLRRELLDWAPEDAEIIEEFYSSLVDLVQHPMPFPQVGFWNKTISAIKTVFADFPLIRSMVKWQGISLGEFARRFSNPHVQKAFANLWHPEMSMVFILVQMAFAHMGAAGYPLGGSGRFVEKLKSRFDELSGHFHPNSGVKKVEISEGKAKALILENGLRVEGDYFILAGDGKQSIYQLLGEGWADHAHIQAFEKLETFPGLVYFSAGIRHDFHEARPSISGLCIPMKHPIPIGHKSLDRVTFQIYNFDPTLATTGKTLVTALIPTEYQYWKNLHIQGLEAYRTEQKRLTEALVDNLEIRFPGISHKIEFSDVATPVTYENETGNYRGSYEGWLPTPESLLTNIPQDFSKVSNVFLSGHWVSAGGGMPPAAFTARNAVAMVCEKEAREFLSYTD